jgi:hypothetical protein
LTIEAAARKTHYPHYLRKTFAPLFVRNRLTNFGPHVGRNYDSAFIGLDPLQQIGNL